MEHIEGASLKDRIPPNGMDEETPSTITVVENWYAEFKDRE
ncbi:MAG: hypothetical protein QGI34_18860 [Candidatus Latescibacteria bacterium]|jgi:hypothetical protein|nr:hypothetical protein [Candidatus Latescibacterota bacterium]